MLLNVTQFYNDLLTWFLRIWNVIGLWCAFQLNSIQLNKELRTQVFDTCIIMIYHFITSDRFPVPVRSAVKSNLTPWCCQNLSNRTLNTLTVQATTELGKPFQLLTMCAEKKMLSDSIMKIMIKKLVIIASGVSCFIETNMRWSYCIVYIMGNFKNFNRITSVF